MEIRVHIYVNERVCLKQLTPNMGWAGGDARSVKNSELFVFKHDAIAMGRHTNMYGNGWGVQMTCCDASMVPNMPCKPCKVVEYGTRCSYMLGCIHDSVDC